MSYDGRPGALPPGDIVYREMCERHMRGEIPNPSGVIEAILTHLVSKVFCVPCAHAPLPYYQEVKDRSTTSIALRRNA